MQIIGLSGRAGCGKDTAAHFMCEVAGFVQTAFADPIRQGLTAMLGLRTDSFIRRDLKEQTIDWLGRSPRELMQTIGTEWGREQVATDIWLRVAKRRIDSFRASAARMHIAGVVISDVRFENEAEWIRAQGGEVWFIDRPECNNKLIGGASHHTSEQHIQRLEGEPLIRNDGTVEDLQIRIAELLEVIAA